LRRCLIVNAIEAIEGTCKVAGITLEVGFAEALLEKLSPESGDVELTYLQVYLDKIFRIAFEEKGAESGTLSFGLSMIDKTGNVSDLLGSFLEEQLRELDEPDMGLAILKTFGFNKKEQRNRLLLKKSLKQPGHLENQFLSTYVRITFRNMSTSGY